MLQIKTTNGNTLIHADQQPDTYNGRSYDGSQYMVHAGEWGRHKYIRKEGNRYIYPEDLQKKASAGLHKVAKAAKDVYEDRGTYAKAAKDMAGDLKDVAERRKYRIKDEMRKQYDERKAKEDHIKELNAKMAEGAKKIVKGMWDSSKIGQIVNLGKDAANRVDDLANSGKKEEVATKSMPKKSKRPLSREKKVVDGGKEIKKSSKSLSAAQKEEQQIRNAHQVDTKRPAGNYTTSNLEMQKKKTEARKIIAENKAKTDAQVSDAHQEALKKRKIRRRVKNGRPDGAHSNTHLMGKVESIREDIRDERKKG